VTGPVDGDKRATLKRFAALGAATPFVGGADAGDGSAGTDDNETRGAIRGYVATTPGAHFSKLRDDLGLGTGETQHHLRRLESAGAVESAADGEYRRFYPAGQFDAFERRALGALRRDTRRGLVIALLREPDATGAAVADRLGVSRPAVSDAAAGLADAGLLDRTDGYTLRRPGRLVTLVVRYADSLGPDAVAFADEAADYVRYDP